MRGKKKSKSSQASAYDVAINLDSNPKKMFPDV